MRRENVRAETNFGGTDILCDSLTRHILDLYNERVMKIGGDPGGL